MDRSKITAIIAMLVVLIAMTAVSGCTTGSMNVSPTPAPTATPTGAPTVAPTAAPVATPSATTAPVETPTATPIPSDLPAWMKPYPTLGPWTPGDDTYMPTPTEGPGYLMNMPWIDQKIQVPVTYVLIIDGKVDTPMKLSVADLNEYPQKTVTVTMKGTTRTFSGASLNSLLNAAGAKGTMVRFWGKDGFKNSTSISNIVASPDALIGFETDGSLRDIIPGQPAGLWIGKNSSMALVRIEVY